MACSVNGILSLVDSGASSKGLTGLALSFVQMLLHFVQVLLRVLTPCSCHLLIDKKAVHDTPSLLFIFFLKTFPSLLKVVLNYPFQIGSFILESYSHLKSLVWI